MMKDKKTIVFLGASIAQGQISSSYVKLLKERLGTRQYRFINHAVAGYESYNVLKKIDKTIKSKPDFVIILVGTNDVMSSLDPELAKLSRRLKKIPHEPSLEHFSNNITGIVKNLQRNTGSKIAFASIPVLGENIDSMENRIIAEYNAELEIISRNEHVVYLPVHEKQKSYLEKEIGGRGKDYISRQKLSFKSLFQHYLLFMNLDSIALKNGYLLLTDGIHQNSLGARYIADEMEDFILS